jgi:hypothetical protein
VHASSPLLVKRGDDEFSTSDDKCKRPRRQRKQEDERTVRFDETPETFEVPGRHGLSPQELSSVHMSKSDHARIQMEIVEVVRQYRLRGMGKMWTPKQMDGLRGLERVTNYDDVERPSRLKSAISAVISQQLNGEIDEKWLSNVYRPFSAKAQSVALEQAIIDRESAFSDAPRIIVMLR